MRQTAVSLFAGIGGFDLALENNGIQVVANCEIDRHAEGVLKHRFPDSKHFHDVQEITGNELFSAGFVSDGGIITGGFPCQDLSVAGKRLGFTGERSSLFYQIARIADETKAEWLVLENVPGLLNSQRGADMGAVVGTLVDLGYSLSWRVLDAQNFGVPQRRRRVFIVARRSGDPASPTKVLFERKGVSGNFAPSSKTGEDLTGEISEGTGDPVIYSRSGFGEFSEGVMPLMATMHKRPDAYIVVDEENTIYDISNRTDAVRIYEDKAMTLPARMGTGGNNVPVRLDLPVLVRMREGKPGGGKGPLMSEDRSLTLKTLNDQALFVGQAIRKLTPLECERLQGFPDEWSKYRLNLKGEIEEQVNQHRYKQIGNAVAVPVVDWIIKGIVAENDLK